EFAKATPTVPRLDWLFTYTRPRVVGGDSSTLASDARLAPLNVWKTAFAIRWTFPDSVKRIQPLRSVSSPLSTIRLTRLPFTVNMIDDEGVAPFADASKGFPSLSKISAVPKTPVATLVVKYNTVFMFRPFAGPPNATCGKIRTCAPPVVSAEIGIVVN